MSNELNLYKDLLFDIKLRVRQGQVKVFQKANAELLSTYWDIGRMIFERQKFEGWGKGVIPQLAKDLKNEISEVKGFSERNLNLMVQFYSDYSTSISQQLVAKLQLNENQYFNSIGWSHHIIIMQKVKDLSIRFWYMKQVFENGWGRNYLISQIKNKIHERQGSLSHNFESTLTVKNFNFAKELFKDPYIFDFTTLGNEFSERELELSLVNNVQKFLLELGSGFAFVGRQYKIIVSDRDFYIDLLFYHLKMRCFVVIDLKKGEFLPEFAGKMSFYCTAVDEQLKIKTDKPTIGLILCQEKDKLFAEYTLRGLSKPIGVSEFGLTRDLPDKFKGSLPSIEEIEKSLGEKKMMY